jgi:hypothetical protein
MTPSAPDRRIQTITGVSNGTDVVVEHELPRVIVAFRARKPLEPRVRLSLGGRRSTRRMWHGSSRVAT